MIVGYFSAWPFFLCLFVIFLVASTPLFRDADTSTRVQTKRLLAMDDMRGILALAVMFHHAAIYHRFLQDGVWEAPSSQFFSLLGPVGVGFFFMITGFLFWSQMISKSGSPNWRALYVGRVFRIGPLYLIAVSIMFGVAAVSTGLVRHQAWVRIGMQFVRWFSLGVLDHPEILNGYVHPELLLADVTWTLQWEWYFYLSLPLLALFARRKNHHLWFVLWSVFFCKLFLHFMKGPSAGQLAYIMLFLMGMLSASLRHLDKLAHLPDSLGSALILTLLIFIFHESHPTVSTLGQVAMGLILYLVVSGSSFFGLLGSRAAIRLGDVSYGIYLLQGLVLALVLRWHLGRSWELQSAVGHWILSLVAAVLLIALAMAAHVWIERPGISLGRQILSTSSRPATGPRFTA